MDMLIHGLEEKAISGYEGCLKKWILIKELHCITMRSTKLIWDNWNREHIKKHTVSIKEIREVCQAKEIVRGSYKGRFIVIGKTAKGRLLTTVLSFEKQKSAYVVSARDSSKKERKVYYESKTGKTI